MAMNTFKFKTSNQLQMLDQDLRVTWAQEKMSLEQKIQFLSAILVQYQKREDDNKKINALFLNILNEKEEDLDNGKESQLRFINNQLNRQIASNKKAHDQIVEEYEIQIKHLKNEIVTKEKEKIQMQAKYQRQMSELRTNLSSYISQNIQLQKKVDELTQQQTQRKNNTLQNNMQQLMFSTINYNMNEITKREGHKANELKNVSSIQSRVNSISDVFKMSTDVDSQNNINQCNVKREREQRVKSYMKKNKNQMKMMMSTLLKTKQQLEEGKQNMTYMMERQSIGRGTNKQSRSFYH